MNEENKVCLYCNNYDAYYVKKYCSFARQKVGYCYKHKKIITDSKQTCELWHNNHTLRKNRKAVSVKCLIQVLEEFATVKQILLEEAKENEVDPNG